MIKNSPTAKRILKNTAYLAIGSIIGKTAMFIVFILVARYFGPDNYGAYTTAFNHVFLMGMFSKLGFDMTLIREGAKDIEKVPFLQNKIFALRFWTSLIVWILTLFSALLLNYDETSIKLTLIMSPLVLIGGAINSGIIEHFTSYFKVIEKMQYATYVLLFRTIIFSIAIISTIFLNILSLYNLAFIVLFSSVLTMLFQIKQAKLFYKQKYSLTIDIIYLKPLIKPIILFGVVSILYEFSLRFNIIMLNKLSSNLETGIYSAAWNLVSVGTLFIVSFSSSIFPNSARQIFQHNYRNKLLKGLTLITILFILFCIIAHFISTELIVFIYGINYIKSGEILSVIIWFLPIRLLSLFGHQILESANYLYTIIFVIFIPTIVNIILNYYLIPKYGALGSAYASVISSITILILSFLAGLYVIKTDKRFVN